MSVMKTFFGSLECQPLISNQFKFPKLQESKQAEKEDEKLTLKEDYAKFCLEKIDPDRDRMNEEIEMDEDSFWNFVFSEEWCDFTTLRLCPSSILKDLLGSLDDLLNDGCIAFESITHFDDYFPASQVVGDGSMQNYTARLQILIYKFPESKFNIDDDTTKEKDPTESISQAQEINKDFKVDESANLKSSEFDEFYFKKYPVSRTLQDSLDGYIRMRLCMKRSKHWDEISRSAEYKPTTFLQTTDESKTEKVDQVKSSISTKASKKGAKKEKAAKVSKVAGKKSKKLTPKLEKSGESGTLSTDLETRIEERLRKPLCKIFEKKLNEIFKQTELDKDESKTEEKKSKRKDVKKSKKGKEKESKKTPRKEDSETTKSDTPVAPPPPPPPPKIEITARISYSDERLPVFITREKKRCPDTIVLGKTCRSNTLWSLPTPARFKCHETKLYHFPWRSVCCLEYQRNKEELRSNMENDLTQLHNLGKDEELISNASEGEIVQKIVLPVCKRKAKFFGTPIQRDARYSCRSIIKREINKINNYKKKQVTIDLLRNKVIPVEGEDAKCLEPSSFSVCAEGFVMAKSAEYLLAAMRKYNIRREMISINASNWTQSFAYITFNRPWKNDCNE